MSRSRWTQLVVLAALLAGFAVVAVLRIPWSVLSGAGLTPRAAGFTDAQIAREVAFHDAVRPAAYAALGLSLLIAAVLGLTRLGAGLVRAVSRPLGGGWFWQIVLGTFAVLALGSLLTLPLGARVEAVRRSYGLSTSTWASWLLDQLRSYLVSAVTAAAALLVVLALTRWARRTWWAWGAAAIAALVVVASFGYPVLVEPVFNSFRPLPAGALRTDLLTLAARDDVPVTDVLVADASRRTTTLNAYVSGFGSSRRIVVYDTLLRDAPAAEVELVVAHELGHAKRQDVLTGTVLGALGAAAGVIVLALLLSWAPLLRRAGADGPHDPFVVPLVLFLVAAGTFVLAPATNLISRQIEARADLHALDLTRDPQLFAAVQRRLALTNLSDLQPNPLAYALLSTHPDAPQRIAQARAWQRLHG